MFSEMYPFMFSCRSVFSLALQVGGEGERDPGERGIGDSFVLKAYCLVFDAILFWEYIPRLNYPSTWSKLLD